MVQVNTKVGSESTVRVASSVGNKGAQGAQGTQGAGNQGVQGLDGKFAGQGVQGSQGLQGLQGIEGYFGGLAHIYRYEKSSTDDSNPGSGKFKFDYTNFTSATKLYISTTDADSANIASFLSTLDDSGSAVKSTITLRNRSQSGENSFFHVVGDITENSDYYTIPVSHISGEATFDDEKLLTLSFTLGSEQGTQGVQGFSGNQGSQGFQGIQGLDGLYAGQGAQGSIGSQGHQGTQGLQGVQGLSNQGVQGSQGLQGELGYQVLKEHKV